MENYISAKEATKWWAREIKNGIKQNNGMEDQLGYLLLASLISSNKISDEQISIFSDTLVKLINNELNIRNEVTLSVDYRAEKILADAADKAEIYCGTGSSFPCKTTMVVSRKQVSVRCGYGSPEEIIFPESYEYEKELTL